MIDITLLKLLNVLVTLTEPERTTINTSEKFKPICAAIKSTADSIDIGSTKNLRTQLLSVVKHITTTIIDEMSEITCTNKGMSNFIYNYITKQHYGQHTPIRIAATLCNIGNADDCYNVTEGITLIKDTTTGVLNTYLSKINPDDTEQLDLDELNEMANAVYDLSILSHTVLTFIITKYGSVKGVGEHFGQNVKDIPSELGSPTDIFEEPEEEDSESGLEHFEFMLSGIEDYLSRTPGDPLTTNELYVNAILNSRGVFKDVLDGQEGAIWDKVKLGLSKTLSALKEGLVAIKENYLDKSIEKIFDETDAAAKANKKAIMAVADKSAYLNESAKAGITRLAEKTNNDVIKSAVSGLSTIGTAGGVIDKLLVEFGKQYNQGKDLQTKYNDVDKLIKALETEANSSPPDDDKEAISVKKTSMAEKTKELRSQFDELKKSFAAQRNNVNNISKAIKGITPAIFISSKTKEENKED